MSFYADQHYLARAISNLVSNANKYAQHTLRLSVQIKQQQLVFIVEDDGSGIEETEREQIFLPYYRVKNQDNSHIKGYGLGLSICQEVARLHQGSVVIEHSNLGGAKFILTLPIATSL